MASIHRLSVQGGWALPTRRESDRPDIASVVLEGHGPVSGPGASLFAIR